MNEIVLATFMIGSLLSAFIFLIILYLDPNEKTTNILNIIFGVVGAVTIIALSLLFLIELSDVEQRSDDCTVCVNECFQSSEKQQFISTITNTTKGVTRICESYYEVCS